MTLYAVGNMIYYNPEKSEIFDLTGLGSKDSKQAALCFHLLDIAERDSIYHSISYKHIQEIFNREYIPKWYKVTYDSTTHSGIIFNVREKVLLKEYPEHMQKMRDAFIKEFPINEKDRK
jgi:hypothetical protein